MRRLSSSRRIRDPLHDYIDISDEERKIIDTLPLQRLRKIKQVGSASTVYPSATHSRFSHSIGVMHLAGMFADSLGLDDKTYRTLRIAGLVHDIGHGPFSHTSDRVAQKYNYTHEERSCEIIEQELVDIIPTDINIGEIKDYILSEADVNIIAGDVDADRIDYLNRDTLNTGLDHGQIDYHTIVEFAQIVDNELVFERKATNSLNEMLSARMYMHNAIVNHHTVRLVETMLERCLEKYVEINSLEEMMKHNDYTMHTELVNSENKRISNLYNKVRERSLPKKSYSLRGDEVSTDVIKYLSNIDSREYEKRIAESVGITKEDVVIVTPKLPKDNALDIRIFDNGRVIDLEEISQIPKTLPEERLQQSRFHVYTTEQNSEDVNSVTEDILTEDLELSNNEVE